MLLLGFIPCHSCQTPKENVAMKHLKRMAVVLVASNADMRVVLQPQSGVVFRSWNGLFSYD
jgi:hypothetical protein